MSKFALLFILVFFGGIIATLVYSPVAAFVLYQLVYFLNPESRWWAVSIPDIRYSFITAIFVLIAVIVKFKTLSEKALWREQVTFKWLLLMLFTYYFTYFIALLPDVHWSFTFEYTKLVIIIFCAYKLLNTPKALTAAIWSYIIGATYIGYVATITGRTNFGRVEGIGMIDGADSNMTAIALVPALIILIYYAWTGSLKVRILSALCAAYIVNGLVLINSRGAFLGAVVGGGFFLLHMIFSKYQEKGQRLIAILVIVFGSSGALYLTDETFWSRMETLQNVEDGAASGSHRVDFWLATFDVVDKYPLGVGIEGYTFISKEFLPEHYFENRKIGKAVHSTWFQILGEVGWLGFTIFVLIIISVFKATNKLKGFLVEHGEQRSYFFVLALEAALLGYLVSASFIDRGRAVILYWLILYALVAVNVLMLNRIKEKYV
ncbi:O-antigen ligase family protein [Alishewanella sp. HL-SH06]|uniref:O-antigen ligase family protein n=1 Tax=Alishewanella sp. HL-SH06 TaxID=3461144 RepID=UPI0040424A3D